MTVLALESSTNVCSAALAVGGMPIACRISRDGGNHAGLLPRFVDELLAELHERQLTLEAVVLAEGPGSYTGLRIATSLAKGLCYGASLPLYTVPTTLVLAAAYAAQVPDNHCTLLCPMIDARRMEVYTALYDTNLCAQSEVEAKIIEAGAYADRLSHHRIAFFGDGATKCQSLIADTNAIFVSDIDPDAQYMALLVENGLAHRVEGKDIAYYDPMYLKEFVAIQSHVKGLH